MKEGLLKILKEIWQWLKSKWQALPASMRECIIKEMKRAWPFVLLFGLFLAPDSGALSVVGYAVGIVAVAIMCSHLARKVLFPYLDLKLLIKEICTENNVAAAIVLASMVALMGIVLNGIITLLR